MWKRWEELEGESGRVWEVWIVVAEGEEMEEVGLIWEVLEEVDEGKRVLAISVGREKGEKGW